MVNNIIKRPILTEKMTALTTLRQYAFEVEITANKIQIADAVEKKFNVQVTSIRTIRCKGKRKTQFTKKGRFEGYRSDWKKAVVTLKEGQSIELLES